MNPKANPHMYCYHTHTHFCDGTDHPEAYVKEAIRLGFHTLGFSGHAPVPFKNHFAIPSEKLDEYCQTIRSLQSQYKDHIRILLALEVDCIPGFMPGHHDLKTRYPLDYTIGSVHLVAEPETGALWFIDGPRREIWEQGLQDVMQSDIRKAVSLYYKQIRSMVKTDRPAIVGHLDKIVMHNQGRYFQDTDEWYQQEVEETLAEIREAGSIVEINTRGLYKKRSDSTFPSAAIIRKIKTMGIPVTISADAHAPSELGLLFGEMHGWIRSEGFTETERYGLVCYR